MYMLVFYDFEMISTVFWPLFLFSFLESDEKWRSLKNLWYRKNMNIHNMHNIWRTYTKHVVFLQHPSCISVQNSVRNCNDRKGACEWSRCHSKADKILRRFPTGRKIISLLLYYLYQKEDFLVKMVKKHDFHHILHKIF